MLTPVSHSDDEDILAVTAALQQIDTAVTQPQDDLLFALDSTAETTSESEQSLSEEELAALARRKERLAALDRGRLEPGSIAWTRPAPFDFVLPGLQLGEVGMLPAPGGTGKTFLMLQLGMSIATGTAFAGVWDQPKKGRVVFLTAEDTKQVLHHRMYYLRPDPSWQQDLIDNFEVYSLAGTIPHLLSLGRNRTPVRGEWYEQMVELARGCRLFIVDPLSRFHCCDENDASHMTMLVQTFEAIAKEAGCAILFTHHSNKNAQMHGAGGSQASARGSSALTDGVRWQMNMWKMSVEEAKERYVADENRWRYVGVTLSKANNTPMDTVIWLERGEGGVLKEAVFNKPHEPLDFGLPPAGSNPGGKTKKPTKSRPVQPPMFGLPTANAGVSTSSTSDGLNFGIPDTSSEED